MMMMIGGGDDCGGNDDELLASPVFNIVIASHARGEMIWLDAYLVAGFYDSGSGCAPWLALEFSDSYGPSPRSAQR